jgi:hypothetical protein
MHDNYKRILFSLDLEKHLTTRQLARLLFPEEYQTNQRRVYDRLVKNLQSLKKENLLKSKDYGLGKENLWSLKPHPIVKEMGFSPPRSDIHTFKYEHEKACADVFVTLINTGNLVSWEAHKKIGRGIIPDRIAELDTTVYIEVEMGSQNKIEQKLSAYQSYYHQTRADFRVLFLVKHQRQMVQLDSTRHYSVELLDSYTGSDTSSA